MAIFGGMNRKPAFGQIPGMGMMQPEMQQPQYGAMAQGQGMQAPPAKQPGFFSKGGGWIDALGAFGDAFGDNGPVYAQGKQREQDLMRQEQMAEQQRMQRREDMQWEWQNKPKDTGNPYRWESNDGSLMQIGPDGKPVQLYKDPTPKMQWVVDGDGGGQFVPLTGGATPTTDTRPAIGSRIADPRKGGSVVNQPATFRPGGY